MIFDKNRDFLPKEICWKTYIKMNGGQGFGTVVGILTDLGHTNKITGKPYSKMDVRYRAYSYALDIETREDAKKDFKEVWERVNGAVMPEDVWNEWLVKTAKSIFYQRPGKYERWIKGNGLQKYAKISADV